MDCGMRCYGKKVGFVVDYVVICVCSVASCNPCYLILYYLKVVKVSGGYDWCPCGAGIFKDGSCDGLVGVDECVFMFTLTNLITNLFNIIFALRIKLQC